MTENEKRELAKEIRKDYIITENVTDEFSKLIKLNKTVKSPPKIIALTIGVIGILIAGFGMSLIMTDLGTVFGFSSLIPGIIISILGVIICIINLPLYNKNLSSRKAKYANEIIKLSDNFLN